MNLLNRVLALCAISAMAQDLHAQTRASAASDEGTVMRLRVIEAGTKRPVARPMVCVRESGAPFGSIGDSLGNVAFGGAIKSKQVHLHIVSPLHHAADTTVAWPPNDSKRIVVVEMRLREEGRHNPKCPSASG
jgi:hypothetical protein